MFCKNCGKELPDNAIFCSKCGTPTPKKNATAQGQKPPGNPAVNPVTPPPSQSNPTDKSKKIKVGIALVCCGAAVMAIILIIVLIFFSPIKEYMPWNEKETTSEYADTGNNSAYSPTEDSEIPPEEDTTSSEETEYEPEEEEEEYEEEEENYYALDDTLSDEILDKVWYPVKDSPEYYMFKETQCEIINEPDDSYVTKDYRNITETENGYLIQIDDTEYYEYRFDKPGWMQRYYNDGTKKGDTKLCLQTDPEGGDPDYAPPNDTAAISIDASSELSEYEMTHDAYRIMDGSLKTAWVEGVSGQGIGEYVLFNFDGCHRVKGIKINAGYQKSKDLYKKNSRPKKIKITFSNGDSQTVTLKDKYGLQNIKFKIPVFTDSIKITIRSVYKGKKYSDTVISELSFY